MIQPLPHLPRYLFLFLFSLLSSALLVVSLPLCAEAQQRSTHPQKQGRQRRSRVPLRVETQQQGNTRQLTQEETEKQSSNKRVALVIGNGAYTNAPRLKNPTNDATDIADALSRLGFQVEHGNDLNQKQMKFMIREFGKKLKAGGQGLFYFSGHGVQLNGHNYLVPVDVQIESEADVEDQGVDVNLVLGLMDEAKNGLNVVILDACRNNPFARSFRSISRGLAKVDAPTGTLIAYATAPGQVAQDGKGRNGTYTAELLKEMQVPGLPAEEMFKRVRAKVSQQTNKAQVPWEESSLIGDFYFNRAGVVTSVANNQLDGATSAPTVRPSKDETGTASISRTDNTDTKYKPATETSDAPSASNEVSSAPKKQSESTNSPRKQSESTSFSGIEGSNWTLPSGWSYASNRVIVRGSGIALPSDNNFHNYRDFQLSAVVKMINGLAASFIIHERDSQNYYLVQITGPNADEPYVLRGYLYRNGSPQRLEPPTPISQFSNALKPGKFFHVLLTMTDNQISVRVADSVTGDLLKLGTLSDPSKAFPVGAVGIAARDYEENEVGEFSICSGESMKKGDCAALK